MMGATIDLLLADWPALTEEQVAEIAIAARAGDPR